MTRQSTRAATAASKAAVKPAKTSAKKSPPKTPAKSKGTGSTPASTAMATLRAKQKKAVDDLAAAEARVRERNQAMLDAEASDDSQEESDPQAPPSTQTRKRGAYTLSDDEGDKQVKKQRPKTADEIEEELQADDMEEEMDPDLQDLALLLGSDGAPQDILKEVLDDGENGERSEQDEDDNEEEPPIKKDVDDDDEMHIEEPPALRKKKHRSVSSVGTRSSTPSTPHTPRTPRNKGRISKSDFSPASLQFAEAANLKMRIKLAVNDAFPSQHMNISWTVLGEVAEAEGAPEEFAEIYNEALTDADRQQKLKVYTWGAASNMRGGVKTKAKEVLSAMYGIPGTNKSSAQIVSDVAWLLDDEEGKARFKNGGLDVMNRTVDVQAPFMHPIIKDIICRQWFCSGTAEGVRLSSAHLFKNVPLPLIALVVTAVENALEEWRTGQFLKITFTEEGMKTRYCYWSKALKNLKAQAPKWLAKMQSTMYQKIITERKLHHLMDRIEDNSAHALDGVDFAALEAGIDDEDAAAA